MSSHAHPSSFEGVLDFSEPFSLTPQQSDSAKSILETLTQDYGLERTTERDYKPAILIRATLDHVSSADPFLTFFLTFLHEKLCGVKSNIVSALSYFEDLGSWEPAARGAVMAALKDFADYMVSGFFLPLRGLSLKTPQPTPSFLSTIQPSNPTGTKDRISTLRRDCLIRDHHRCVVTRKFDRSEAEKRYKSDTNSTDDDGLLLQTLSYDDVRILEAAHILPHSLAKLASGKDDLAESKKNVLRILNMFDTGITHLIDGPKIDSPSNALTLTQDIHRLFGAFEIYFEPTGRAHEYRIKSLERGFLRNPLFPVTRTLFLSPNNTIDPPSPRLLAIHRAIAIILNLSGAAEYIEKTLEDLEELTVEADGSTNLGELVSLQLIMAR